MKIYQVALEMKCGQTDKQETRTLHSFCAHEGKKIVTKFTGLNQVMLGNKALYEAIQHDKCFLPINFFCTNNQQNKLLRVNHNSNFYYLIFTLHKNVFKEVVIMLLHLLIRHVCNH